MQERKRQIFGWIAVGFSILITCFWTFWGIIENFHEGWYSRSLWRNLQVLLVQYVLVMLVFMGTALLSLYFPRVGALLHFLAAGFAIWFFSGAAVLVVYVSIALPLVLLGACYWIGRATPRKLAARLIIGIPLVVCLASGLEPAIRVAGRIDDGNREARRVQGKDIELVWAPAGPGWPDHGVNWEEAKRRCQYLSADGKTLAGTPQNIWRLPTIEEAVRSMARHGKNSGGIWNAQTAQAAYEKMPDKESPLWDMYSKVIYWWTATEVDDQKAYIVVYNGQVWPRPKKAYWGYLGFRAVQAANEEGVGYEFQED